MNEMSTPLSVVSSASRCPFTRVSVDPEPSPRRLGDVPPLSEPSHPQGLGRIFCVLCPPLKLCGKLLTTSPTFEYPDRSMSTCVISINGDDRGAPRMCVPVTTLLSSFVLSASLESDGLSGTF